MKPQNKQLIFEAVGLIIMLSAFFYLGYLFHDYYNDQRKCDGIWVENSNRTYVYDLAKEKDKFGDWVCVNVKGMDYNRAIEVCNHEVGHEIFAEVCEKNMSKCLGVLG